jgi:hypothetical protein
MRKLEISGEEKGFKFVREVQNDDDCARAVSKPFRLIVNLI